MSRRLVPVGQELPSLPARSRCSSRARSVGSRVAHCSITGPGYRYLGDGLIQRIATDFERYRIPVVLERVVSLHGDNGLFILETDAGTRVRALSVIVATGMRALANERHFLGRGLFVTYMGYEYFPKLIDRVAEAGRDGVVVFGNHKSAHLAEVAKGLETSVPVHPDPGRA